jgi:hypothetical protein
MNLATQSLHQDLPRIERARDDLGFFSSESVLNILKLILAGTELPDILAIIARLVESQGDGTLCTIWLPHADGKHLYCAAAPSLPGFAASPGLTLIGPKGASWGRQFIAGSRSMSPTSVASPPGTNIATASGLTGFAPCGRDPWSRRKARCSALSPSFIVKSAILTPSTSS